MNIEELRSILRRYKLTLRKRAWHDFHSMGADKLCPYQVNYQGEWRFNINPEAYQTEQEVQRKIKYELREEYIPYFG
jgi:hypothetical protein